MGIIFEWFHAALRRESKFLAYKVYKLSCLTHQASFSVVRDLARNRIHSPLFRCKDCHEITPYGGVGVEEANEGNNNKTNNSWGLSGWLNGLEQYPDTPRLWVESLVRAHTINNQ